MYIFHAGAVERMSDVGDGGCNAAFLQVAESKAVSLWRFTGFSVSAVTCTTNTLIMLNNLIMCNIMLTP